MDDPRDTANRLLDLKEFDALLGTPEQVALIADALRSYGDACAAQERERCAQIAETTAGGQVMTEDELEAYLEATGWRDVFQVFLSAIEIEEHVKGPDGKYHTGPSALAGLLASCAAQERKRCIEAIEPYYHGDACRVALRALDGP